MPYFIAIDAGGTSTRALLADGTRILSRASTTSIKLMRVSAEEATRRLHTLLEELSTSAALPLAEITRTCIGLAGITIPAVRTWASEALAAKVSGHVLLLGDEEIALDAAFPSGPGILIVAGTGSNCVGRDSSGTLHRAGGYGPILGDQGSGYWIGLEALRAALRALDDESVRHSERSEESPHSARITSTLPGAPSVAASPRGIGDEAQNPATQLLTAIRQHWNLSSFGELIELGNHRGDATRPAPDFAALTPLIARLAASHLPNPIAAAILKQAGHDLAHLITQVAGKIATASNRESSSLRIAYTGSVLTHIPSVHESMLDHLVTLPPNTKVLPNPIDPLEGALHRARAETQILSSPPLC